MKKIILAFLVIMPSCQNKDEVLNECVDHDKWGTINACPYNIDPVCGCNNVTYDNECFAKAAGVISWTEGACD
jgi:hypothetical protein